MNLAVDFERVCLANKSVRADLLAERSDDGRWIGQLSSSPLATAAAVSALVVSHESDVERDLATSNAGSSETAGELMIQGELSELLVETLHWLARCQNTDGGWGDCDLSRSNLAATLLVQAAFRLTGVPAKYADLIVRADDYVAEQGGILGLWRMEGRESLVAPILANAALAGMISWRQVPTLPFELVAIPAYWQRLLRIAVEVQTLPAVIAVGRAKFYHDPPQNPISRLLRGSRSAKALALLERFQATDGSFADSTLLTAIVVMCLAESGCKKSPIVARGVEFLLASVRPDASWSIYSNQVVRNTAMALRSVAADLECVPRVKGRPGKEKIWAAAAHTSRIDTDESANDDSAPAAPLLPTHDVENGSYRLDNLGIDWLLDCQLSHSTPSHVPPGGWALSDAPGAPPNVGDTASVLLTLARLRHAPGPSRRERLERAARLGVRWLFDAQNADGGWPTFGRSRDTFFEQSSATDLTAAALRALAAWRRQWRSETPRVVPPHEQATLDSDLSAAIERGCKYLALHQRDDGSFIPRWFGNESQPDETNPVIGTALVLTACNELELCDENIARRAANWLLTAQHAGGGWGPPRVPLDYSGAYRPGTRTWRENEALAQCCTVEETSLAVAALMPLVGLNAVYAQAVAKGLHWIADAVEQDRHRRPAVLGWCFPKLGYHERLQSLVLASAALNRAVVELTPQRQPAAAVE